MNSKYFNEEHELFRQSLRAFLEKEVVPNVDQWEEERRTPREIWKKMGAMGFLGLAFPEEYGGSELDFFYDVVFNEELGRINSGGFVICQQVVQYMSAPYILKYGSKLLKDKYLPGLISGELISCIGITEPGAGSDAQNIQTRAVRQGDHYLINGSKVFITNGVYGDIVVCVTKTQPEAGAAGVSLIVVDLHSEGVSRRKLKKLGWHASDTAELSFDNVKVPVENLIGEEGKGFYYLMNGLQLERICGMPAAVKGMEKAIEVTLQYMSERKAFGRSINQFQVLRHRMAELASEVEALKAFCYYCCQMYADNIYDTKLCSMLKLLGTELTEKVSTTCLQMYGGYGFMEEYPMARMYRDCRVGTIGGGSSEVLRNIIAKIVIDGQKYQAAQSDFKYKNTKGSSSEHKSMPANGTSNSFASMVEGIQMQAGKAEGLGQKLKFDFGDQQLVIDGTSGKNEVSTHDAEADCTVEISLEDFKDLVGGNLNPMNAMMSGKMKINGDMSVAMKLQSLFT